MEVKADFEQQKYLLFDLGHNEIKCAQMTKNVNKHIDYFAIPTHLYPYLDKDELYKRQFNKQNLEMETLRQIHS